MWWRYEDAGPRSRPKVQASPGPGEDARPAPAGVTPGGNECQSAAADDPEGQTEGRPKPPGIAPEDEAPPRDPG